MGGILAAEVALLPAADPYNGDALKHRILGLINFDVPFLGMHPGVVKTGLGSLFQPKISPSPNPSQANLLDEDKNNSNHPNEINFSPSPFKESLDDRNFDPAFHNDKHLTKRTQLGGALNYFKKNYDNLTRATRDYVFSYFEFGGCLADYSGLRRRYRKLTALEELDEYRVHWSEDGRRMNRVRFINYYTSSTGFVNPDVSVSGNNQAKSDSVQQLCESCRQSNASGKFLVPFFSI
jgi:hypothetical protein